ncbi:MAG: ABC transporter ATP-binding protein [Bacteroidetes bacterium]|nr:ABC transporter ATP-binding protein [Bacteroidota bacterium]
MAKSRRGAGPQKSEAEELPKAKLSAANFKKSLRLFSYIKKQKWKFALGMFFLILSALVGLYFPIKSGDLLGIFGNNNVDKTQLKTELFKLGGILLSILLAQSLISFFRVYMFAQVTENILEGIRNDTYQRIIRMPMSFFSKNQVSEISSRIATDVNVISDAFTINIAEFIRQSIVGIGGLVMMVVYINWDVAKWFLFVIPPLTIVAILFAKKIRGYSKNFQDKIAEANVIVGESLTGITNVKVFTNEHFEISKFMSKTKDIKNFGLKYGIFRGTFFAFIMTFVFGSIFFLLFKMIEAKIDGVIAPDEFGKFMMLSLFVAASLGGLPEQIANIQRALGATDRVFELIDGEIEDIDLTVKNSQASGAGKLSFQNVCFSYPTRPDFQVLKNISFTARAGQTIALVGSSGSGKTTIANLILRFYSPDKGSISIDDIDIKQLNLTELRSKIAMVPQDVILFAGTIRENIAYGKPFATNQEIEEAAKKANALDFINSFPQQMNTVVGERGIQLSGGQRQRIAIARAVLKNPLLLVLDEATSSLDSESEKLVQEALDKLMLGRTSIVIAHRLATIRKADKIIVLQKGEISEEGTHESLMKNDNGFYQKLSKMQFELN